MFICVYLWMKYYSASFARFYRTKICLSKEDSKKEKYPNKNHHENWQNHGQQAADISP